MTDATTLNPGPSVRSFKHWTVRIIKASASALAFIALTVAVLAFLLWDADWWLLRDKIEHIRGAMLSNYVNPECRADPDDCQKRKQPSEPQKHACETRLELSLHCRMHTIYDEMNAGLFASRLPGAVITLQRERSAGGYFAHGRFRLGKDKRPADEIALNPQFFKGRTMAWLISVLAHEMCHQEIAHFDTPSKNGFHSMAWARCMLRIGLRPVSIDRPGQMTGMKVTHQMVDGGSYALFAARHPLIGTANIDLTQAW